MLYYSNGTVYIANFNEQALRRHTGGLSHQADTAVYYTVILIRLNPKNRFTVHLNYIHISIRLKYR